MSGLELNRFLGEWSGPELMRTELLYSSSDWYAIWSCPGLGKRRIIKQSEAFYSSISEFKLGLNTFSIPPRGCPVDPPTQNYLMAGGHYYNSTESDWTDTPSTHFLLFRRASNQRLLRHGWTIKYRVLAILQRRVLGAHAWGRGLFEGYD